MRLIPLRELYFAPNNRGELSHGSKSFVAILVSVGLAILFFAVVNYINLSVAQAGFRAKEMATRRLLGSSRGELFLRLIIESTLVCAVAFGAGAAFLCRPRPHRSPVPKRGPFDVDRVPEKRNGSEPA